MWVFTVDGFFSVVQHRSRSDVVLVRARSRAHLARFCEAVGLDPSETIHETLEADYRWRVEVVREFWTGYLRRYADLRLDYPNFQNAAMDADADASYAGVLHRVWATMQTLQEDAEPMPQPAATGEVEAIGGAGQGRGVQQRERGETMKLASHERYDLRGHGMLRMTFDNGKTCELDAETGYKWLIRANAVHLGEEFAGDVPSLTCRGETVKGITTDPEVVALVREWLKKD